MIAGKSTAKSPSKPKAKPNRKLQFWHARIEEELLNFSPYGDTEESISKVFKFCNDFIRKLQNGYSSTLSGRIDNLINTWIFNRITATEEQEWDIIDKLIKLSCTEIKEVCSVLKEIHTIQEKECSDVISNAARQTCVSSANFHKLFLELSALTPVWIGSINETAPRLVGAIPAEDNSGIKPGQYVAAFVWPESTPDGEVSIDDSPPCEEIGIVGSWILARVLTKGKAKKHKYHKNTQYTIVDVDKVPYPHYIVQRKVLIPLPIYRADPRTNPEAIFPIGSVVLALYMNTTCFYPAVVLDTPKTLSDTYTICFRDMDTMLQLGPVVHAQQRYVIKYVEPLSLFTENQKKILNDELKNCS